MNSTYRDTAPRGEAGTILCAGVRGAVRTSDGMVWMQLSDGGWALALSPLTRETFAAA